MNPQLMFLMATTSLFSAGNLYYAQPLLGEIARSFGVDPGASALIPVLTQIGYVVGLMFLTPLGDILEKRRLILGLLFAEVVILLGAALSRSFFIFEALAFCLGISSVLVQVLIPFVASLSAPKQRAKNLGIMVGTALVGILFSRAISGVVAAHAGWRSVYYLASSLLFVLFVIMYFRLPEHESSHRMTYPKLLRSLYEMTRDLPALRSIAINGALLYAGLCAFWASLIFYLESDAYHLGAEAAGLFGFVGALGAGSASLAGKFIERHGSKTTIQICMVLMALAFLIMGLFGATYVGLIIGVIALDVGAQGATVTNQNELYLLHPTAQARLNTIYKMIYFLGGASGSAFSAWAWPRYGWAGVCGVGFLFICAAALWEFRAGARTLMGRTALADVKS